MSDEAYIALLKILLLIIFCCGLGCLATVLMIAAL